MPYIPLKQAAQELSNALNERPSTWRKRIYARELIGLVYRDQPGKRIYLDADSVAQYIQRVQEGAMLSIVPEQPTQRIASIIPANGNAVIERLNRGLAEILAV